MEFIFLGAGIIAGVFITWLIFRERLYILKNHDPNLVNELSAQKAALEKESEYLKEQVQETKIELDKKHTELVTISGNLAASNTDRQHLNQRLAEQQIEIKNMHEQLKKDFENLANSILEEKSQRFTKQNKENLELTLAPLKDRIKEFQEKVEKANTDGIERNTSLLEQIKTLKETNMQMSKETLNLTKALKGENKTQGNWGEMVLERILESSGLVKGQEYRTQVATTTLSGNRILPDVIVDLPDNRHIIIDSKVSLTAYESYSNAEDEIEKHKALRDHIISLKSHIKGLFEKNYPTGEGINTPDFVLLFLPIESSFAIAMQEDKELFEFAWTRKIVIVSPSTLLASLRTISSVWKQEKQTKNALEIAEESGKLYDKFVSFVQDMEKLGDRLKQAQHSYDSSFSKLKSGGGNLVNKAEKIRHLGAKTHKTLPDHLIQEALESSNEEDN